MNNEKCTIKNTDELAFAVFCIENLAKRLDRNGAEIYRNLTENTNVLNGYIVPCFDALHTQDKEYILDDIIIAAEKMGVKL